MIYIFLSSLIYMWIPTLNGFFFVFDEEFILVSGVLLFLGLSYSSIAGFLIASLDYRYNFILDIFRLQFEEKRLYLNKLLGIYKNVESFNKDLSIVIGSIAFSLGELKSRRNLEVEQFLLNVVNLQLYVILTEELFLLRNIYLKKLNSIFSNLAFEWKFFDVSCVLSFNDLFFFQNFEELNIVSSDTSTRDLSLLSLNVSSYDFFAQFYAYLGLDSGLLYSYLNILFNYSLRVL